MAASIIWRCLAVLGPLVLATNLVFLLRCEVILDVERLADLLGRLALDHICNGLAPNIEQSLDVKVVGCEDDLKEHFLVHLHEFLVPFIYVRGLLSRVGVVFVGLRGITAVVVAPLDNLLEDCLVYL